jgi:Na+-transporting NADH:ubiquinone oxidoreductase subunit NqrD
MWDGWVNWSAMVMAPGAFFMLALFIWIVKGPLANRGAAKKEAKP